MTATFQDRSADQWGDSWLMRDSSGLVRYIARSTDEDSHSVNLTIVEVTAWENGEIPCEPFDEVAVIYVKWDGCAHIGFRDPSLNRNWVHVCGAENMIMSLRMLEWAWNLAVSTLRSRGFDGVDLTSIDSYRDAGGEVARD